MKRLLALFLSGLFLFLPISPAFAQTTTTSAQDKMTVNETSPAAGKTTRVSAQVTNLQTRALKEIDRRLIALNEVVTIVGSLKKLPEAQKTTLTTKLQAEISSLTNVKTKITADTDIDTLRTDVKSIVSSYRVFALFIPQIHLLAAAEELNTTIDILTTIATKLDSRLKEASDAGKSTDALQKTLIDMQDTLADAKKQYESIMTNVTPLTPDGYPGNKTTLVNARGLLTTGRKDVLEAAKDAKTIITSLKAFRPTASENTATTSATPSPTK